MPERQFSNYMKAMKHKTADLWRDKFIVTQSDRIRTKKSACGRQQLHIDVIKYWDALESGVIVVYP